MNDNSRTEATVWQDSKLVETFLEGVQRGIPYADDQIVIGLRVLSQLGRPVASFADLGSGDGRFARAVLTQYPEAEAVLVDFSEPMLARAREQMDASKTSFVIAGLESPDWRAKLGTHARFDAIVSRYAIHHLPDNRKRALYQEIFDLLQPGGMFLNIEHVQSPSPAVETLNNELFVNSLFAYHQQRGSEKTRDEIATEFVYREDKQANILTPVETQLAWLREIGFQEGDCYFKVFELAVFGGRKPA